MQAFGKILVHPDWQDAVIVQLRTILASFDAQSNKPLSSQLPALTWNLSHQTNSVLFHIASPMAQSSDILCDPEFWQQFAASMQTSQHIASEFSSALLGDSSTKSSSHRSVNALPQAGINTAFTLNKSHNQLRFVVTQSGDSTVVDQSATDSMETEVEPSEQLMMAVYLAPTSQSLPSVHWLDGCFADTMQIPHEQRYKWLLAGRPASGYIDPGKLVCSCMAVGENIIINAITKHHCTSAVAVGKQCRAGTNCGSCVGQINALIAQYAPLSPV